MKDDALDILLEDLITLLELSKIESPANIIILPYIALILDEGRKYLEENYDYQLNSNIKNNTNINISKVRSSMKVFQKSYNKELGYIQNGSYLNNTKVLKKIFKGNDKIGIFINENSKIVANSYQINIVFNLNGNSNINILNMFKVINFGRYLGLILRNMIIHLDKRYLVENNNKTNIIKTNWKSFDIKTKNLSNESSILNNDEVVYFLVLHSLLNFMIYEIKRYTHNQSFILRVKYLCAYYVDTSIKKFYNNKRHLKLADSYRDLYDNILEDDVFNTTFRNCMAHFDFYEDGNPIIKEAHYNKSKLFCGLIQSCFELEDELYIRKLDEKLMNMSLLTEKYLDINFI